jgi:hypothetical protein
VVLHCSFGVPIGLEGLVETFLRDGVRFVGVAGPDARSIEDLIDEIIVGDGSDPRRHILTASHPTQSLAEAVAFASGLTGEFAGEVQIVEV